jgi:hypothetical protein
MTVKELMAELERCDPNREVWVLTEAEFRAAADYDEGANCIVDRVSLVDDDNPDAVESLRSRQRAGLAPVKIKWSTFPVLITKSNE